MSPFRRPVYNHPVYDELRSVLERLKAKTAELNRLDDEIAQRIIEIEEKLRARPENQQRLTWVPYDGGKLAWSRHRPTRKHPNGRWRFVIQDDDDAIELMSTDRDQRCHTLGSPEFRKLVEMIVGAP